MTRIALGLVVPALLAAACTEASTELIPARNGGSGGMRGDAAVGDGGVIDAGTVDASPIPLDGGPRAICRGGRPCQCDNGIDEDVDGLVDGLDPECTGPFDDDESSFATGLPGGTDSLCRDCFWDSNAGFGDDRCAYHADCLLGQTPTAGGDCTCEPSEQCVMNCRTRTPNGCDCFGCCEVTKEDGDVVNVVLSQGCSTELLDDRSSCTECVQSEACRNPCGRCELCPGRRPEDLPADCPRQGVCEENQPVCSATEACPTRDFYCQLGCCQQIVVQ
jgi:hypothetical protein